MWCVETLLQMKPTTLQKHKLFFDALAQKVGIDPQSADDWYLVKHKQVVSQPGWARVLHKYGGSFRKALISVYPTIQFDNDQLFPETHNVRKLFFEQLAHDIGFLWSETECWYRVSRKQVLSHKGGAEILQCYRGSLRQALLKVFPSIGLNSDDLLSRASNPIVRRKFFDKIAKDKRFHPTQSPDGWYGVEYSDIIKYQGWKAVLSYHGGSYVRAILDLYSELKIDHERLLNKFKSVNIQPSMRKDEDVFQDLVQRLFAAQYTNCIIILNAKREANFVMHTHSGRTYYHEVDVWIPDMKIGFEYQDKHHYTSAWYAVQPLSVYKERDLQKREKIESAGNTLIVVPCWWDGHPESLVATIHQARPEILPTYEVTNKQYYVPIPKDPPVGFFADTSIPDVGELMLASFVSPTFVPDNWWMGEKYDGIRGCWNPRTRLLYSKSCKIIDVMDRLKTHIPAIFIDGELWIGRGKFRDVIAVTKEVQLLHGTLRLVAFDVPSLEFQVQQQKEVFEKRYAMLCVKTNVKNIFVIPAHRMKCSSRKHMTETVAQIITEGGEGVILRQYESVYENGRSLLVQKYKVSRDDEAVILQVRNHKCSCRLADNRKFVAKIHPSVQNLTQVGDVVSFKCLNYTKDGLPIGATVFRVRKDLEWKDIVIDKYRKVKL